MGKERKKAMGIVLALLLGLGYFSPMQASVRNLPEAIALTQGQTRTFHLARQLTLSSSDTPVAVSASQDETLSVQSATLIGDEVGTSRLTLSLLGLPIKQVEVKVSPEKRLVPGGMTIGVAMRTDGVLVVGTGDIGENGSPAAVCGIRPGDLLRTVDGVTIRSAEQLARLITEAGQRPLSVEYVREGTQYRTTMTPMPDASTGTVRMGAWVRDSTAGIGTMSFYDPDTGRYAALGHAITDGDTGQMLTVSEGQILHADVVAVQKGEKGLPGELKGSFLRERQVLGSIGRNCQLGIYGTLSAMPSGSLHPEGLPVGLRSGVHTGPATILSTVDETGTQAFEIEITRVNPQSSAAPKSMVLRVTDERLLEKTGGIVQGMSGSPIIQDGKLIGAVTHVFVSDPTQGYGLYIDWMLENLP